MAMKVSASSRASARGLSVISSAMMSADAWLMAQPLPVNAASSMTWSWLSTRERTMSSPQLGFTPSWEWVASSSSYLQDG